MFRRYITYSPNSEPGNTRPGKPIFQSGATYGPTHPFYEREGLDPERTGPVQDDTIERADIEDTVQSSGVKDTPIFPELEKNPGPLFKKK